MKVCDPIFVGKTNSYYPFMKKFFTFFALAIVFYFTGYSQTSETTSNTTIKDVILIIHHTKNPGKVHRVPMRIPIEVWYDTAVKTIEVSCPEEIDGQVYLYDSNGNIVGFSPIINTVFNLPATGTYTIFIESEEWYAEGIIDALI